MLRRLALLVAESGGQTIFASASTDSQPAMREPWTIGHHRVRCFIPRHLLAPGQYFVTIAQPTDFPHDHLHENVLSFTITEQNSLIARDGRRGVIAPMLRWEEELAG